MTQGVRRSGSAAIDLCHVAMGVVDGYWEYRLKPWDVCAGVLIVEEAGGKCESLQDKVNSVFLANSSVSPPCMLFIFILTKNIYRITVSRQRFT